MNWEQGMARLTVIRRNPHQTPFGYFMVSLCVLTKNANLVPNSLQLYVTSKL